MDMFKKMFKAKIPVIGVVHLSPLPGSPCYIVENFGDKMFLKKVGPEVVAVMTYIAKEIKESISVPIGMCVLQSDAIAGLAISKAVGAEFIRVPYYTETYIVDAGMMESIAAETLRYRKFLESDVKIFAD